MDDASDAAAGPRFGALGDDQFGSSDGGVHTGDEVIHLGFPGAEFGRQALGSVAVAEWRAPSSLRYAGQADLTGTWSVLNRFSKIIVMRRWWGERGGILPAPIGAASAFISDTR